MAYTLPTISNLLKSRNQAMTDSEKRKKELLELIQQVQSLGVLGVNSGKPKSASKNGQSGRHAKTMGYYNQMMQTQLYASQIGINPKISYGVLNGSGGTGGIASSGSGGYGGSFFTNGTFAGSNLNNKTMRIFNCHHL